MAKAEDPVPRPKGRPKADNDSLLDGLFLRWLQTDEPIEIETMVPAFVTDPNRKKMGEPTEKVLIKRLRAALRPLDFEERARRTITAAAARGIPVPLWLRDQYAAAKGRREEHEAWLLEGDTLGEMSRRAEAAARPLTRIEAHLKQQMVEGERVRELVNFYRRNNLRDDTPVSVVARFVRDWVKK